MKLFPSIALENQPIRYGPLPPPGSTNIKTKHPKGEILDVGLKRAIYSSVQKLEKSFITEGKSPKQSRFDAMTQTATLFG